MDIKIGFGVYSLKFGQRQKEVELLFGLPNKKYQTDFGNIEWCYFENQCVLKFGKEVNYRLCWIELHSDNCKIFGQKIIRKDKQEVLEILSSNIKICDYEEDDYGSWESITCSKNSFELQFTLNQLTQFNFGFIYDEKKQIVWP